ncbi:uncharacterized protein MCYG_01656 [Microsporum canis CBS 113480]|uniref:Uncharacterized protein n=1 Tax=Arthroderma otae (strain ATCC MYA-4605 / CBS 113480) TaxID=554155 RepID=C5FHB8_ARTOC|nr:uncharacterized protein MCYG_01656 [Microsporum canis CBS 113480]EEQ28837.1 predicted protein [Microsporum canis CBS 113480]
MLIRSTTRASSNKTDFAPQRTKNFKARSTPLFHRDEFRLKSEEALAVLRLLEEYTVRTDTAVLSHHPAPLPWFFLVIPRILSTAAEPQQPYHHRTYGLVEREGVGEASKADALKVVMLTLEKAKAKFSWRWQPPSRLWTSVYQHSHDKHVYTRNTARQTCGYNDYGTLFTLLPRARVVFPLAKRKLGDWLKVECSSTFPFTVRVYVA